MQILEDRVRLIDDAMFPADPVENPHQAVILVALQYITVAVFLLVFLLQPRKMSVELFVVVFAIAVAQGQADPEIDDARYLGFDTIIQDPAEVFLRVVDERQERRKPDNSWDARVAEHPQNLKSFPGRADIGLKDPAQGFIKRGQRHLNHAFGFFMNAPEQIQIA